MGRCLIRPVGKEKKNRGNEMGLWCDDRPFWTSWILLFCLLPGPSVCEPPPGAVNLTSLRLVHVVYRHGDRSALSTYPTDPLKGVWPHGFGQLTPKGMLQQYRLGQYLRSRYKGFLNKTYINWQIRVRSTDRDRTLMSAYTDLAGLFPPNGSEVWNSNIFWQPIPVHTISLKDDHLLYENSDCPRYSHLYSEALESTRIKNFFADNKNLIDFLVKKAKIEKTLLALSSLYDTVFCGLQHNYSLPEWMNKTTLSELKNIHMLRLNLHFHSPEMRRLRGGVLVGRILENILKKVNKVEEALKLYMYSAHDTTVAALLSALALFDGRQPPYASCVMVELHESKPREHFVKVFYKNDSTKPPEKLAVPGCDHNCPLLFFKHYTQNVIPVDIDSECMQKEVSAIIPVIVLVLILTVALTIAAIVLYRYKKHGKRYSKINQV